MSRLVVVVGVLLVMLLVPLWLAKKSAERLQQRATAEQPRPAASAASAAR